GARHAFDPTGLERDPCAACFRGTRVALEASPRPGDSCRCRLADLEPGGAESGSVAALRRPRGQAPDERERVRRARLARRVGPPGTGATAGRGATAGLRSRGGGTWTRSRQARLPAPARPIRACLLDGG